MIGKEVCPFGLQRRLNELKMTLCNVKSGWFRRESLRIDPIDRLAARQDD